MIQLVPVLVRDGDVAREGVTWKAIDDSTARATVTDGEPREVRYVGRTLLGSSRVVCAAKRSAPIALASP